VAKFQEGALVDDDRTQIITLAHNLDTGLDDRLHCLEQIGGSEVGRRYLIGASGVTLGRAPPADIVLGDSEVSRLHCRLSLSGDTLIVTDLNSTNGAFIDGTRLTEPTPLRVGEILRVGRQAFKHEWLTGEQLRKSDELDRDLATAFSYVQALLPAPLREGPIRTEWLFQPCAKLGGDAFGYGTLSGTKFYSYLFDVSGHGAGAAMHSVAVMNLLRQRALPNTDMLQPGQVLATLNDMFQMEDHADMYFTMWYGVYDLTTRRMDYASAGHHPAYLLPSDRSEAIALRTANSMIGAVPGKAFKSASAEVPPGASLHIFSDGVFEIVTKQGLQWSLSDYLPLMLVPAVDGLSESERLFRAVRSTARSPEFDDDFTLVVLTFD
jgi:serine phosphatase RsbU (regulator of sigma subunit)